ncbi:hypothetical protein [Caulobacter phage S2B]|uniref:Uncharacterized protein n=1 Tax=Caulobacter phage S2B TaxID=2759120 RepID=A0AAE7MLA5_9CAUD|nr:hypothetical protein [Caulobacter phage S2B]
MADLMADLDAALAEDPELNPAASFRTARRPRPRLSWSTRRLRRTAKPCPVTRRPGAAVDYGWRGVVGGVADAAYGFLDTVSTLDANVGAAVDRGVHAAFGFHLPGGLAVRDGALVPINASERAVENKRLSKEARGTLKTFVPEPVRGGAKITRDISEFAANFIPLMKASEGVNALGAAARWTRPMVASAVAAYQKTDPMEGNLANVAEGLGVKKSAVAQMLRVDSLVDALSVDADDSEFEARLKNTAADGVAGLATEGAFKALGQMVKIVRSAKVEKAELEALAKAVDAKPEVNTQAIREALDEQAAVDAAPTLAAKADPRLPW